MAEEACSNIFLILFNLYVKYHECLRCCGVGWWTAQVMVTSCPSSSFLLCCVADFAKEQVEGVVLLSSSPTCHLPRPNTICMWEVRIILMKNEIPEGRKCRKRREQER